MAQEPKSGGKGQALGYSDVLDILDIVDGVGEGCELTVDVGDFHLHFVKEGAGGVPAPVTTPASAPTPMAEASDVEAEPSRAAAAPVPEPLPADGAGAESSGSYEVKSPMVGTFYRRPAPDKPPFVEVGQDVGPDDAVCLVEVMKLFNTVMAGQTGRVVEICVEDASPVTAGQVLVRIDPAS